jgi:cell wall-associated NlpC family hydrolase
MMTHPRRRRLTLVCAAIAAAGGAGAIVGCGGASEPPAQASEAKPVLAAQVQNVSDDAEAAQSSPLPPGAARGPAAPVPTKAAARGVRAQDAVPVTGEEFSISPGAPSDDEIRAELKEMKEVQREASQDPTGTGPSGAVTLTAKGNARIPADAPKKVAQIIGSANAIARFPYVYGGGHGADFIDTAYDCSGSVSYALAGAGLMDAPLASGGFERWGEPGPGRWVTIYTSPGHMFMTVGGVRYDTSGRSGVYGSRWNAEPRPLSGYTVRHPKGL